MNLVINTYTHTFTKSTPSEYSLVTPVVSALTDPTYRIYKINSDSTLTLQDDFTTIVTSSTEYTIKLEEGLYILEFENYGDDNYYTLLSSYEALQTCLLDITSNLICTDLCNECYPDWVKDSVVLLSADYFFNIINSYFGVIQSLSLPPTTLSQLTTFSADATDMVKLASRLGLYCDNCFDFKADCGC